MFPFCSNYRYAAYCQFTWWVNDRLGRYVRKVIPACVVKAICLPLRVELYFFGAHWRACGLTFWCVETKLEWHPLLSDVCSNYLAKYLIGTHFQNMWAQSVRNRHDSASFKANFLSLSEQAICLKDLYLLMEGDENLFLY